jgi:hypothetical protein
MHGKLDSKLNASWSSTLISPNELAARVEDVGDPSQGCGEQGAKGMRSWKTSAL